MTVTALLVCHDGERWLPAVLRGLAEQTRTPDRLLVLDTGSTDAGPRLIDEAMAGPDPLLAQRTTVLRLAPGTSFPEAVEAGLAHLQVTEPAQVEGPEWLWLLHDDARPAPDALAALLEAAAEHPTAALLGPKIREWPSLRRLVEVGVTISGTGRRETGLERGEYDQGQHDRVREVLAVNTAGLLVRRDVHTRLGGLDPDLPVFGNDLDLGWRAARAGYVTLVVPRAVLFHAEAARRGIRTTELTGTHPHRAERAAALHTLLANASTPRMWWLVLRLFLGTWLRVLGLLVQRAPGEALDEIRALGDVYGRPGRIRAARAARAADTAATPQGEDRARVRGLLAPWWLPYRHGLDFVVDVAQAMTASASDVAERRRAARLADAPPAPAPVGRHVEGDDDDLLTDSGWVVRFLTNPVAVGLGLALVVVLAASRGAWGEVFGGALSPAPGSVADWWRLHVESSHALGTGSDVPAPGYVAPLALLGTFTGGPVGAVSVLMLAAVPLGTWGAWRLLRVLGHLVDASGLPRGVLLWGSLAYGLVPATSGAWGQGRFGVVAASALLPWLTHAALGFADPEPRRRWQAGWRVGMLLALTAAFVPLVWPVAIALVVLLLGVARGVSKTLLADRSSWLPPVLALAVVPVVLAPWLVPMLLSPARVGLLLEAGRLPVSSVGSAGLLTGHLTEAGAPSLAGVLLVLLAVLALVPGASRVVVLACWVVALAAGVVVALLSRVTLHLGVVDSAAGLGLFVVILQGTFVAAVALGLGAAWRASHGTDLLRRGAAWGLAGVVAVVPLVGLGWWLGADDQLTSQRTAVVPAYMVQSSLEGAEHGVLVLAGSVEDGLTYRIRRDDGITVGEDEILALTGEDEQFTDLVTDLASRPTADRVEDLAGHGIEYVVMTAPVDGEIAATLDSADGLAPASAGDRSTRAWKVDRPLGSTGLEGGTSWTRWILLAVQALAVLVLLVLCGPDLRPGTKEESA